MSSPEIRPVKHNAGWRLWRLLASRWFSLVVLLLLAAGIWFLGPLLSFGAWQPLVKVSARLVTIIGVAGLFALPMLTRPSQRRNNRVSTVVNVASIVTALVLTGLFGSSFYDDKLQLAQLEWEVGRHDWLSAPHGDIREHDASGTLISALRTLDALADLDLAATRHLVDSKRLGFGQAQRVADSVSSAYRRGLAKLLLPFVVRKLEQQLNGPYPDEFLYQALRVYLMLGEPRHRDSGEIAHWMGLTWAQDLTRKEIERVNHHLEPLLESNAPVTLDDQLVRQIRLRLQRVPTAVRLYSGISIQAESVAPAWRITDQLDDKHEHYFVRISGEALSEGVPGLYTAAGYAEFQQLKLAAIEQRDDENWVLPASSRGLTAQERAELDRDLETFFAREFIDRWKAMIDDLNITPVTGIDDLANTVTVLSSPDSPAKSLLLAIVRETSLTEVQGRSVLAGASRKLDRLLNTPTASPRGDARALVRQAFAPLHRLFHQSGTQAAPIDRSLAMLSKLGGLLNALTYASNIEGDFFATLLQNPSAQKTMQDVARHASRQPAPLNYWLQSVSEADFLQQTAIVSTRTEEKIRSAWQSDVLPLCRQALSGRYPFSPQAAEDVTWRDFTQMFAPGGILDEYWQAYIEPHVDTTRRPYRLRTQLPLDIGGDTLRFFEQVNTIRSTLFEGDSRTMKLPMQVQPVTLSADVSRVTLTIGEQRFSYEHGPVRSHSFVWSEAQSPVVAITFADLSSKDRGDNAITATGPWALFRLLDQGEIESSVRNDVRATFTAGGNSVTYRIAFGNTGHFPPTILADLQCPARL